MGIRTGKRTKQKKLITRVPGLICLAVVLAAACTGGMHVRAALENEKSTETRSVHMQDGQIPQATLAIGSHLIHINGMTDELYAAALESANEFNQHQMYYKSELANGAWFEISEAVSIEDISTSGNPVNKSIIEALEFTHMTGANGMTTDLRNGQFVSVFDMNNPYDLNKLEELEPLRIQYQILQEKTDKNDSDKIYLKMIQVFFEKDIQTDRTRECDASLKGLEDYKNGLSPREKPAMWTEKTEGIMASVDAERRVLSLTVLSEYLDTLENSATGMGDSNKQNIGTEEEPVYIYPEFDINSEIVTAIGDCIKNVNESINAYEAKRMTDTGTTTTAKAEYRYSQDMIVKAKAGDTPGCDRLMEALCDLQNIINGIISDQERELSALTSDLVNAAFQKYAEDLRAGVSQDYQAAQSEGVSQAVLSKYLSEQKTVANADRLEYQTMLEAQFKRMNNGDAQKYTLQLIDGVPELEGLVVKDAAESYLKETLQEHLAWLRKEYAEQVKNGAGDTEMEKLEKEKQILAKQRQDALDKNNLAEAARLLAEMEAKQKDIDDLLKRLNDILNSPNSSESDKAKARAELGDNNAASRIIQMADNLVSDIRGAGDDTNKEELKNQMAALGAAAQLDPQAGENALDQVKEALDEATGLDADAAEDLGSAVSEALDSVSEITDSASLNSEDAFKNLLDGILGDLLGMDYESASASQKSAAIVALEWYGANKNSSVALDCAASLTRKEALANNPHLYDKLKGKKEPYMSLQALGKTMGYRYIFDDKHNTVTLQKSKEYYLFTLGRKQYQTMGNSSKSLKEVPEFSSTLYIHQSDSKQIFDIKAEYIEKTSYGIVGTPQIETLAKEIYDSLLEGGA